MMLCYKITKAQLVIIHPDSDPVPLPGRTLQERGSIIFLAQTLNKGHPWMRMMMVGMEMIFSPIIIQMVTFSWIYKRQRA